MPGVDLNYFIRQANKLNEKREQRIKELTDETLEAKNAGDGLVSAASNGMGDQIKKLTIDKKIVDPNDIAMLEDLVTAAINSALTAGREHREAELSKLTQGVKIPGFT
jgi:DNA-binding YbaB/EbfC family protein